MNSNEVSLYTQIVYQVTGRVLRDVLELCSEKASVFKKQKSLGENFILAFTNQIAKILLFDSESSTIVLKIKKTSFKTPRYGVENQHCADLGL